MKDYKKILKGIVNIINTAEKSDIGFTNICNYIGEKCPELKESEDERIRKTLIEYIKGIKSWNYFLGISKEQMIAWLEKQDNSDKSLYIRFGDIPTNGKSKVYNGEIEIGIEEGISVYPAFEDKEGNIILGLNLPITKTSLHTQQHLLEYDNRPCYLVTGDYVGKGTDGEPLIKNVRIIKEIKPYRIKQDKENNTYIINNTPNCGISVYNEELKDSADERIRKMLIEFFGKGAENNGSTNGIFDKDILAWLEKQVSIDENEVAKCVLNEVANSIMRWLDANLAEGNMCLSNMECEDIENAVRNANWQKIYGYMKKKLEKQDNFSAKWEKNIANNKPALNHSVLMKNIYGIAEGEWNGKEWIQYRWSSKIKDSDVLYWMNLYELEKQGKHTQGNTALEAVRKEKVEHLVPQKGEYYICIKDYCLASNYLVNTKDKIYKSPRNGYINNDKGVGLSWTNSCTENYFRPVKEEDWIVCEQNNIIGKPLQYKEFMSELIQKNIKSLEDKSIVPNFRLWDISDAKDGDVLADKYNNIGIYKEIEGIYWHSYIYLGCDGELRGFSIGGSHEKTATHPATKEQRYQLEKAMADAGYEFDFKKKELKKIEQKPQRMISAEVKEALYDKSTWSEEDETNLTNTIIMLKEGASHHFTNFSIVPCIDWLKSLKYRVQPKQEMKEEDLNNFSTIYYLLDSERKRYKEQEDREKFNRYNILCKWFKSIKKQFYMGNM